MGRRPPPLLGRRRSAADVGQHGWSAAVAPGWHSPVRWVHAHHGHRRYSVGRRASDEGRVVVGVVWLAVCSLLVVDVSCSTTKNLSASCPPPPPSALKIHVPVLSLTTSNSRGDDDDDRTGTSLVPTLVGQHRPLPPPSLPSSSLGTGGGGDLRTLLRLRGGEEEDGGIGSVLPLAASFSSSSSSEVEEFCCCCCCCLFVLRHRMRNMMPMTRTRIEKPVTMPKMRPRG